MIYDSFEEKYEEQEREYLVLMSDESGGGAVCESYVVAQAFFLAYMDVLTNELKSGDGRLSWPVESEEAKKYEYFHRFKKGTIYRIKARKLIEKTVSKGMLPSYYNDLYVTEVLEEEATCKVLEEILEEYRKPIILQDEILGELVLDKDLSLFEGHTTWLGNEVEITLDIDKENRTSWTKARNAMKKLLAEQQKWDIAMRQFAASKLTSLANEWQDEEDEDTPDISEKDFAERIRIESISMTSGGSFSAYFNDDDMFWGHVVAVGGSLKKGVKHADMEG